MKHFGFQGYGRTLAFFHAIDAGSTAKMKTAKRSAADSRPLLGFIFIYDGQLGRVHTPDGRYRRMPDD